ncbi:DUF3000 family protein [Schaalia cardiffensis]|uniref:DUF3000 family protein n=1 Tax=Schaalia cardiffensis TaxID=181487 RepID=UPI0023F31AF5|nr:DUF3000 family protein [Schaalia cardiffensis]
MDEHALPDDFVQALLSLREAPRHPKVVFAEAPGPSRLAPYTAAIVMRTLDEEFDEPLATGRLVILYDPDGSPAWNGTLRLVAQFRSHIDPEMSADPLLAEALWAWTDECLTEAGADYHDLSGTVTREISESYGGLVLRGSTMNVEMRASWTAASCALGEHLNAWTDVMLRTCGVSSQRFLEGV